MTYIGERTHHGRTFKYFTCDRCAVSVPDYMAFGSKVFGRERDYCLDHIPWWSHLRLWWQERWER